MHSDELKKIIEGILMAAGEPLSIVRMAELFPEEGRPSSQEIQEALAALANDFTSRGITLIELASGYTIQVKSEIAPFINKLWQERPARPSRALLETLALIAYRQPITRGEIEEIRGVSLGSNIIKTLMDNEWVRIIGQREVPGRPSLYATTRKFLDHFNLKSLDELPTINELTDLDKINIEALLAPAPTVPVEVAVQEEEAVVD